MSFSGIRIEDEWFPHLALFAGLMALGLTPVLLRLLGKVLEALLKLVFAALAEIVPAAAMALIQALGLALPMLGRMALLLWFMALEACRGAQNSDDGADGQPGPAPESGPRGLAEACALLGLPEDGFSAEDLKRAYRQAIRRAHPDQGGSSAETMAIIRARARINEHFGWH